MSRGNGHHRSVTALGGPNVRYTIGTLVTNPQQYADMRASFEAGGFSGDDCEYIVVDNTQGNTADAYDGLRSVLQRARGTYTILCHQDVVLLDDLRADLDRRLEELTALDPHWALAGNAGGVSRDRLAIRITDKHGADQRIGGPFPARVVSLDENFIVVRTQTRVSFSRDLGGFHMYGADICLNADILGYSAYVIDFHLRHDGEARTGKSFAESVAAFRAKWSRALRPRFMQTTCTGVLLSASGMAQAVSRARHHAGRVRRRMRRAFGAGKPS